MQSIQLGATHQHPLTILSLKATLLQRGGPESAHGCAGFCELLLCRQLYIRDVWNASVSLELAYCRDMQVRGKKILVLDPKITGFLGLLAEVPLLKEHGVEQ